MARTLNEIVRTVTKYYISHLNFPNLPMPSEIETRLVTAVKDECLLDNHVRAKGDMLRPPTTLCPMQIAMLMLALYPIVRIESSGSGSDPDYDLLAMYQADGANAGIYVTDETVIKNLALEFNYLISVRELDDVIDLLMMRAPRVKRTVDRDLIAVNNGIFNYDSKQLMPFDPKYVFLAKSKVNYNPAAMNVVIHNPDDGTDWDVESWMAELSDDPEVVELLWQILSAIIRPHVRWNKSDSFYRRQLFIPFDKCFTGKERKYIKEDYLHRKEVLEYVLYRVLTMNFYTLSEPASCKQVLGEFRENNDPVRQFWSEMEDEFAWDLLPRDFVYDLYKAWFRKNCPSGTIQGKNTVMGDINKVCGSQWIATKALSESDAAVRPQGRMDWPEPLIVEYNLVDWMSKTYKGDEPNRIAMPPPALRFRAREGSQPPRRGLALTCPTGNDILPPPDGTKGRLLLSSSPSGSSGPSLPGGYVKAGGGFQNRCK